MGPLFVLAGGLLLARGRYQAVSRVREEWWLPAEVSVVRGTSLSKKRSSS